YSSREVWIEKPDPRGSDVGSSAISATQNPASSSVAWKLRTRPALRSLGGEHAKRMAWGRASVHRHGLRRRGWGGVRGGGREADDLTAAKKYAGVYSDYVGNHDQGDIWMLEVRPDKSFVMGLEGLFGCNGYKGYDCPSTWSDGPIGWTQVSGTWATRKGGLKL